MTPHRSLRWWAAVSIGTAAWCSAWGLLAVWAVGVLPFLGEG